MRAGLKIGNQAMRNRTFALLMVLSLSSAGATLLAQSEPPPPPPDQPMAAPQDPQAPPPYTPPDTQAPPAYAPPDAANDPSQAPAPDVQAPDADPTAVFYSQLSPYGSWTYRDGYGQVWVPKVDAGWRPYTTGHWVYTDEGWAWVADEPWGWAAFHYGRWFYDAQVGWGWVPGTVWAPAWVAWRNGGGYVGWAPLPPTVGWSAGVGLDVGGVDVSFGIRPESYCFVSEGAILEPRVAMVIVPAGRNVTIIRGTTNITNITVVNNRVVNRGIAVEQIERVTGRPVPRLQIAAAVSVGGRAQVRAGQVAFFQPPAIARVARQTRAEFGRAGVPVVVQPKAAMVARRAAPGGEPRTFNAPPRPGVPVGANVRDLQARHDQERAALVARQSTERQQMQDRQRSERAQAGNASAKELADRHASEQRALDQQHQKQQQELAARHQNEISAAQKAAPKSREHENDHKPPAQR
jgi:hypothetical protein